MKRVALIFFCILFFSTFGFSETELEKLWTQGKKYNSDLYIADFSIEYAISSLENKNSLYPFSLRTNFNSSFSDGYSDLEWYTTNSSGNISVVKENPFGNSFSGTLSYGISRGILNIFAEKIDRDNIGYSHNPSVSFSIEQSLYPAFFQGVKSDPNVELLRKNLETSNYSKDTMEESLIENITYNYIQQRCTLRELDKYEKYLSFYDSKIQAGKEMLNESQISIAELWNMENKRWEYYEGYLTTLNSKKNIALTLKTLCGTEIEVISENSELPRDENPVFNYNPIKEKLLVELTKVEIQNILDNQNFAPTLTMGVSFSESTKTKKDGVNYIEDKNSFDWSFSLGINFSNLLSSKNKLRKEQYENNLEIYQEQLKELEKQNVSQRENFEEIIKSYELEENALEKIIKNKENYLKDYEIMFENGKCSKFELEEIQLSLLETKILYENLKDNLWFYKWKRAQCK